MMARILSYSRFCKNCGAAVTIQQKACSQCHLELDPRYAQWREPDVLLYSETTLKIPSTDTDPDATIKASSRLPSHIYLEASQLQTSLEQTHLASPAKPKSAPSLFKARFSRLKQRKLLARRFILPVLCTGMIAIILLLSIDLTITHHGQNYAKSQAKAQKIQLDRLVANAVKEGVPQSSLQPITTREMQIEQSDTFLAYLPAQATSTFYQDQAQQYRALQLQVSKIVVSVTEQLQQQAQHDLQDFQIVLSRDNIQPVGNIHYFSQQFSQDQLLISSARGPKDYIGISKNAVNAITALHMMEATFQQLTYFRDSLTRIQAAHIDVTAWQSQYQNDLQSFNTATQPDDFQNLNTQLNVQYQQIIVNSIQSFPYISIAKLNVLTAQIQTLKTYNIDPTPYQKRLYIDQVAQKNAGTISDKLNFFKQIDTDIASMNNDLVLGEARFMVKQFHQEVDIWARQHLYHDVYDGHDYAIDNGYMHAGIGATLDLDLSSAHTLTSLTTVVAEAQNALFNLRAFEADYDDKAPYDQAHASDLQLMNRYQLQKKQVLVISLAEQALRLYQNGGLVRSYRVTTGRQGLPSLPGVWAVLDRRSPVIFKSDEPANSPYWFPDTPISYAILYHYGGYFIHDAPWRATFGPGTQFPHQDASGNTSYNFDGSHGCVNLTTSDAAWIYKHTDWSTIVVIY